MQTDRGVLIYRFLRRRSTTAWLETASFRRHRWTSKLAAGIQTVLATLSTDHRVRTPTAVSSVRHRRDDKLASIDVIAKAKKRPAHPKRRTAQHGPIFGHVGVAGTGKNSVLDGWE